MKQLFTIVICGLAATACAHAPQSGVTEEGPRSRSERRSVPDMVELGAFEAADPPHARPTARRAPKRAPWWRWNRAGQLRADYVQIFRTDRDSCNRVVIRAMAFSARADAADPAY